MRARYLIDPSGNVITFDDDDNSTADARMRAVCNDLGRYTIIVSSYQPGSGGAFTVTTSTGI